MECLSEKNMSSTKKNYSSQSQREYQSRENIDNIEYSNSQNSKNHQNFSNSQANNLSNNTLYHNNVPYISETYNDFSKSESMTNLNYNPQSADKSSQFNQNSNINYRNSFQNSNTKNESCFNQYYSEQKNFQGFLKDFSTNKSSKSSVSKKTNEQIENISKEQMNQVKKNLNSNNIIINNGSNNSSENNSYTINYNSKINGDIIETDRMNLNDQYQINTQYSKHNSNDLAENININNIKNPSFEKEQNIPINKNIMPKNIYIKNKILSHNNNYNCNDNNNQKYSECYEEQKISSMQKYEQLKNKIHDLEQQKQKLEQDINNEKMNDKLIQINNEKKIPFVIGNYSEFKEYENKILNNEEISYDMENSRDILGEFVDKVIERSYNLYKNRYCSTCAKLLSSGQSTKRCPKNHHRLKNNKK